MDWIVEVDDDLVSPDVIVCPPAAPCSIYVTDPCPKDTGFCPVRFGGPPCGSRACGILIGG